IFSIPLVQGTMDGADEKLDGIFISQQLAERYFGETWQEGVVGQTMEVDGRDLGKVTLQVLGVFENLPDYASFDFEFFTNVRQFAKDHGNWASWRSSAFWTYFKLEKGANVADLKEPFAALVGENGGSKNLALYPQKMGDTYLFAQFENGEAAGGRIIYVRIFFFASLFLMLMACINFVNLATVQATRRSGEVGVRKVIGAGKSSLFFQYMAEAILITLTGVILAVLLCEACLPYANQLLDKEMSLNFRDTQLWMTLLSITAIVSLLAGAYPALLLSSLPITNILKNKLSSQFNSNTLRKGLVVTQFVLAALVLTSSLIIQQQVHFIQHKNLGMNRNQIIQLKVPNELDGKTHELKNALLTSSAITEVSQMQQSPINIGRATDDFSWPGKAPDLETRIQIVYADRDLQSIYKMEMVEGAFHRKEVINDYTDELVLNEKAVALMGLKDPVGKTIRLGDEPLKIVGVVKDFHANSMHDAIQPLAIFNDTEEADELSIRYEEGNVKEAIHHLETTYQQFVGDASLQFQFLDEAYNRMYQSELLIGQLANFFTIIALFISTLGLLGLIGFMADQRTKEIGIRKVLGASVGSIVRLLSKDLLRLVLIAFV
ncbi:MAG: ABC transporter permease, partial [Bacteroidota bacterium]